MDSRLESIFSTTFRRTEAADTRQDIRREDIRDEGGKKDKRHEKDKNTPTWEDRTVVSVQALKMFLENLAGDAGIRSEDKKTGAVEIAIDKNTDLPHPPADKAAQAARAYQSTAKIRNDEKRESLAHESASNAAKNPVLSVEEIRAIHALIADLGLLSARGVAQLEIRRSDSFLQSLSDAASAAIQSL